MARVPDLIEFAHEHKMLILTVAELIRFRLRHERYIVRVGESMIQTKYGEFRMIAYQSEMDGGESHLALVRGDRCADCAAFHAGPADLGHIGRRRPQPLRPPCEEPVLVRVHARCTAGDLFGAECGCRETLDESMRRIAEAGCGVILYLHNTSRGFAIDPNESQAPGKDPDSQFPQLDDSGPAVGRLVHHKELRERENCEERILREVGIGGQMLTDLGVRRILLISNTTRRIPSLEGFGLEIVEQVPVAAGASSCTK